MSSHDLQLEKINSCPVCKSTKSEFLDTVNDTLIAEINRYLPASIAPLSPIKNIRVTCIDCGLVYLSPRLNSESLSKIYGHWYNYAYRNIFDDEEHLQERIREFRNHHLKLLDRMIPALNKEGGGHRRVLDIGTGSGLFLKLAKATGWDTVGIELDEKTAKWGAAEYNLDVRFGQIDDALHADEFFDAITMFDYLEHTERPDFDLQRAAQHLKEDGHIFIRVPNQMGFQSRFMGKNWLAVISNHLSYFTPESLTNALELNGFEVVDITAKNYRTQIDIVQQRARWLKQKLNPIKEASNQKMTQEAAAKGHNNYASEGSSIHKIGRLAYSLLIEQIDHIGGLLGHSNFLMVVARKR